MAEEKKQYLDVTGLSRVARDFDQIFVNYQDVQQTVIEGSRLPISGQAVFVELEDIKEEIKSQFQFGSKEYWESHPEIIATKDCVYFYTDAEIVGEYNLARMKVGDGESLLRTLPFIDDLYYQHINNNDIHVSAEDRYKWNNKVRAYMQPDTENLILTIN